MTIKSVCVFCGSSFGTGNAYGEAAKHLAGVIASRKLTLVYGGAHVGLMGAVADAALAAGGRVVGVLPEALREKELAHHGLDELHIVSSMHERKAKMADLSGAFVALPGGVGTLEEIFEIWTWGQLGYHAKPSGFLNVDGYYDDLFAFLRHQVERGFVKKDHFDMTTITDDAEDLLDAFSTYRPPATPKWINRETS